MKRTNENNGLQYESDAVNEGTYHEMWKNNGSQLAENDEINIGELLLHCLDKIHWILLTGILFALIAGLLVIFIIKPEYEATSKIYIVGSDSAISLSDLQIGSNLTADYMEVFSNWHVHELVNRRLNLDYSYKELEKMLTITNPNNTHIIYVSVRRPDPEEAKLIADTYAQVAREFIAAKMDMREPNIFEEAKLPDEPVAPRKIRDIIIGFALGILLSVITITVRYYSDDRISTAEDVLKAGKIPVLGMIPLQEDEEVDPRNDS